LKYHEGDEVLKKISVVVPLGFIFC